MTQTPHHRDSSGECDDALDPFVERATRQRGSILKPILMIAVIILLASLIPDYQSELAYYFESDTPVELGTIHDYPGLRAKNPDFSPPLRDNTYVHLEGIPTQRGQSTRTLFYRLVGDDIFVEEPKEVQDELEQLSENKNAREITETLDRSYVNIKGRLLSFAHLPGRYNGVRRYYSNNYAETFCETLTPEAMKEKEQRRRDAIISQWKEEYQAMSAEERKKSHMKPLPTAQEVAALESTQPLCIRAFLVQAGKKPADFVWYLVGLVVIIIVMIVNVALIIRWWQGK